MSDMIDRDAAIAALKDADLAFGYGRAIDAIRAIPAAKFAVKPGEIERAVWSAMMWAADNNPGFNGVPEYTDGGNSFAEGEARRAVARIRSALTAQPSPDVAALVDYVLQDDLHNRLTPRVVDIAYSAFMLGRRGKNKDDGGPCDWFNDTKPMVDAKIAEIRAALARVKGGGR